jgi:hypothetical protein
MGHHDLLAQQAWQAYVPQGDGLWAKIGPKHWKNLSVILNSLFD